MSGASSEYLAERARWLILIRWIAAPGVVLVTFVASRIMGLSLSVVPLYSLAALLAVFNLLYSLHLRSAVAGSGTAVASSVSRAANIQISLDLLFLGALIHFSGGVENPFLFYFVFHMITASILLARRAAFLQATLAVAILCSVTLFEYLGILHHYCLTGFVVESQHGNALYILGTLFALSSTLFAAVYMASSVALSLRERDARLEEMNELLVEKDGIQSEYVYRVTHDIKGHLSAIRGCLDPVISGITGTLNPDQLNLIRRAGRRTDTLMNFVRALLDLTRIRLAREIEMEGVPVADTIGKAVSYVNARAAERSVSVVVETDSSMGIIQGARVYLEETVANLLANAVKYSREGGRVTVSGTGDRGSVRLEIRDEGIGIPPDDLPRVFEEFYRAANAKRVERDGTGLGLSMARQVVERHGGSIRIESEEGHGTTVTLVLPRCSSGRGSQPASPELPSVSRAAGQ
jgi:signal transduction histidine kinase